MVWKLKLPKCGLKTNNKLLHTILNWINVVVLSQFIVVGLVWKCCPLPAGLIKYNDQLLALSGMQI